MNPKTKLQITIYNDEQNTVEIHLPETPPQTNIELKNLLNFVQNTKELSPNVKAAVIIYYIQKYKLEE